MSAPPAAAEARRAPEFEPVTYRSDIDGLRAIAVLPVVLYHAGFGFAPGGFVGVDVFFVISGFLITSIIVREIDAASFRLAHFYERRARRLFPALFTVVAASCVCSVMLLLPWEFEDFGQSVATTALFTSNFLFFSEAGYFDGPAELKPLLHTWSLAIEEQYYLLFPALLILVRKHLQRRYVLWVTALLIGSLTLSAATVSTAPDAAFYLLPSRTWELMLGSLLALVPLSRAHPTVREAGGWIGLAMIVYAVAVYSEHTVFPGLAAVVPCLGTALIIANGQQRPHSPLAKMLSTRALVGVGLISYSLYLWHWPVLVFAKHYWLRPLLPQEAAGLVMLSLLLAWLSWRFIERPFRGSSGALSTRGVFAWSGAAIVVFILVGVIADTTKGLPGRLPEEIARIAAVADDKPANRRQCEGIAPQELRYERVCRVNAQSAAPTFAVWGDSHAMAMMSAIGDAAAAAGRSGLNLTSNGCVPLLGLYRPARDPEAECLRFATAVIDLLQDRPEIDTVVLAARWARHAEGNGYGNVSTPVYYLATDSQRAVNPEQNRALFASALDTTINTLLAMQRRVVLIGAIPEVGEHVPNLAAKMRWHGQPWALRLTKADHDARQAFVQTTLQAAGKQPGVIYLDPAPVFCAATDCDLFNRAGMPLYFDDNHVSSHGAELLVPFFEQMFEQIPPTTN